MDDDVDDDDMDDADDVDDDDMDADDDVDDDEDDVDMSDLVWTEHVRNNSLHRRRTKCNSMGLDNILGNPKRNNVPDFDAVEIN